jgi:DNA-binding MarR family transcriptional regulator
MTELSRHLFTDNSAVTRLVDKMEKEGWVRRGAAPGDRRASPIHISNKGRTEALRAREIVRSFNEEIKSVLTGDELETFKKVLGRWTRTYRRGG